ncbi:hypothetical protein [Myxosarcina sp. GI1]|uniref:hypothetical protein n=1 Tax=Myxosarcina sp. GI1 TaxID=1541065 RepID=UPI00068FCB34|nr:hypothetical protein [Myxosarcina sp. GI1]
MTQNSAPTNIIRPDELMEELGIKKDAYYKDLNYLDITPEKDSEGKAYLFEEQADEIRALRNHVNETGKRNGFDNSSLVKVDDSNKLISNNNEIEEDIYINREEPTDKINSDIFREAEELAARGMAMNDLVKIQLASQMNFDDLSPDLQEKINIAREVANPKFRPADIATQLLAQHRTQKVQTQG